MALGSIGPYVAHPDPQGHYALLGVAPDATPADIIAAFRRRARTLHPDIPGTGNLDRFIAVKQAYDLLSDPRRRASYDRDARGTGSTSIEDPDSFFPTPPHMVEPPMRRPRLSDMPLGVWLALGLVILVCATQLFARLIPAGSERTEVQAPPTAPGRVTSDPLTRPTLPRRPHALTEATNHYTTPGNGPVTVWRHDTDTNRLVPIGQLQPFTPVQALRLFRQPGLMEIRLADASTGLVQSARLNPGNTSTAHRAFCIFNAGPTPNNAEVLTLRARGTASLLAHNRETSPAVVKLRNRAGGLVAKIFLMPGEQAQISGLPDEEVRADYAFGEAWSHACGGFAVGQQAWRMPLFGPIRSLTPLVIPPDPAAPNQPIELSDPAFSAD